MFRIKNCWISKHPPCSDGKTSSSNRNLFEPLIWDLREVFFCLRLYSIYESWVEELVPLSDCLSIMKPSSKLNMNWNGERLSGVRTRRKRLIFMARKEAEATTKSSLLNFSQQQEELEKCIIRYILNCLLFSDFFLPSLSNTEFCYANCYGRKNISQSGMTFIFLLRSQKNFSMKWNKRVKFMVPGRVARAAAGCLVSGDLLKRRGFLGSALRRRFCWRNNWLSWVSHQRKRINFN